ncbi:hypothetical protein A2U01_0093969, partial [Trifolium medium]|nr:hypothetical protein [Trifolium medium]
DGGNTKVASGMTVDTQYDGGVLKDDMLQGRRSRLKRICTFF